MRTSPGALGIDKRKTTLIVIDLQKGVASMEPGRTTRRRVISNVAKMAEKFRENKMPVFLVHVIPTTGTAPSPLADTTFLSRGSIPRAGQT